MIAIGDFTRSSSFRVGVLLTSLAVAAIIFIIYFWRLASSDVFIREAKAAVDAETYALSQLYQNLGLQSVVNAIETRDFPDTQSTDNTFVALQNSQQELVAGNVDTWPLARSSDKNSNTDNSGIIALKLPYSLMSSHGNTDTPSKNILYNAIPLGDHTLFVGRNIQDLYSAQWLGKTFSWVVVALLCILGVISFAVATYVVRRINRMSQTADNIICTGNLKERLEIDSNWDDLSRLSLVFNQMLDTIETSVNNIKSVSDSIAHDLRTPLARLRNTLEKIEDETLRNETTQEADNLLNMFNSLLRISGLETTGKKEGFCETDLRSIVADVIDLYMPVAEDRKIQLVSQLSAYHTVADPNLLFQAVANILDNAIKYTPDKGTVTVQLTHASSNFVIMVNDNGLGVSEDDISQLERRFFRADGSRSTHGNGLGLSLVSAIVKLHKGALWFVHDPLMQGQGLGVVITLPRPNAG